MDAAPTRVDQALADLTEISSRIEAAVVATPEGEPVASTLPDGAGRSLARAAAELLREAGDGATAAEAATAEGSLFAVRGDGDRVAAAVTGRDAPSGLVLYDLRACLRRLAEEPEKPKRTRAPRKKKEPDAAS